MKDGTGRKEIFKIFQKSRKENKRNGYKRENTSKLANM